jgi:hypothetical protein
LLDIEIVLPRDVDCEEIARVIDDSIDRAGLATTMRASLKKFPGCIHWHVKNGRESGTLEITLWPQKHRAWFTIQSGRKGSWIDAKMKLLQKIIRQRLNDPTSKKVGFKTSHPRRRDIH